MPITNISVDNWEQFEARLKEIRGEEAARGRKMDLLYRGLADSNWELTTTLERAGRDGIGVSSYYDVISRTKPSIESLTASRWNIPPFPEVDALLRTSDGWKPYGFPDQPTYNYMIHLRHHGFPSTLLDWARSEFIAAFFAFRNAAPAAMVSICACSREPAHYHTSRLGEPQIYGLGPFVTTHRRHYSQQSEYSMCGVFHAKWHFAKHDDVFARADRRL